MAEGYCPECDNAVKLGAQPKIGQHVTCMHCGAYLEVMSLSPVELDWATDEEDEVYEYEYDFDQDDEDYDYD